MSEYVQFVRHLATSCELFCAVLMRINLCVFQGQNSEVTVTRHDVRNLMMNGRPASGGGGAPLGKLTTLPGPPWSCKKVPCRPLAGVEAEGWLSPSARFSIHPLFAVGLSVLGLRSFDPSLHGSPFYTIAERP